MAYDQKRWKTPLFLSGIHDPNGRVHDGLAYVVKSVRELNATNPLDSRIWCSYAVPIFSVNEQDGNLRYAHG